MIQPVFRISCGYNKSEELKEPALGSWNLQSKGSSYIRDSYYLVHVKSS